MKKHLYLMAFFLGSFALGMTQALAQQEMSIKIHFVDNESNPIHKVIEYIQIGQKQFQLVALSQAGGYQLVIPNDLLEEESIRASLNIEGNKYRAILKTQDIKTQNNLRVTLFPISNREQIFPDEVEAEEENELSVNTSSSSEESENTSKESPENLNNKSTEERNDDPEKTNQKTIVEGNIAPPQIPLTKEEQENFNEASVKITQAKDSLTIAARLTDSVNKRALKIDSLVRKINANGSYSLQDYQNLQTEIRLIKEEIRQIQELLKSANYAIGVAENKIEGGNDLLNYVNELEREIVMLNTFLTLSIVLSIVVIFFMIRFKRQKEQLAVSEREVLRQRNDLKRYSIRIEALLKEIHHRVKNNLQNVNSILNLQAYRIQEDPVRQVLQDIQRRIHAMGLIHRVLQEADYNNYGDQIPMKDYIEDLNQNLSKTFNLGHRFHIYTKVMPEDLVLQIDAATNIGLIVTELVSNSFKHAFLGKEDGNVWVSLERSLKINYAYQLSVLDDGPGLGKDKDLNNPDSLGWQLVRAFIARIGGELRIDERAKGAKFIIYFNKPEILEEIEATVV